MTAGSRTEHPRVPDSIAQAGQKFARFLDAAPKLPLAIIVLSVIAALFAPALAPHDPISGDLAVRQQPPLFAGGSSEFPLGTDRQGRDILTRVIFGSRVSLSVAAMSILWGGVIGSLLGLLAGLWGGWIDSTVMILVDVTMAFPSILIALVLAAALGPSFWITVGVISFIVWARYARLVRGEVLSVKQRDFVSLARIGGNSGIRIAIKHIFPNVFASIMVLSTLQVGWAIVTEGFLSFLGAGIPPPTPSWGGMVAGGRNFMQTSWWISVMPGIAIMVVVLGFNVFGDWLRDALDPRLRQL